MNIELLNLLEEKHKKVLASSKTIDLNLEDSMFDDFIKLFEFEFSATVDQTTNFRQAGWYSAFYVLDTDILGTIYYHPLENKANISYDGIYISKDRSGLDITQLFNKFHSMLEDMNNG